MEKKILSLSKDDMKLLLDILDYKVDENEIILNSNNEKIICPFTKKPVKLNEISIMPGSTILMNTSPLTLSEYFYQYLDD